MEVARLKDPDYFETQRALYAQRHDMQSKWYIAAHTHTCPACARQITHTGLEATRDEPLSHYCCGRDVRT